MLSPQKVDRSCTCRRSLLSNGRQAIIVAVALLLGACSGALDPPPTSNVTAAAALPVSEVSVKSSIVGKAKDRTAGSTVDKSPPVDAIKAELGSPSYKIGPLDILEVVVFKVPDLNRTVTVAENGAVNLPLVGETSVVGMTAQEIERDLAKRLDAKYLKNPQVSVTVKEFNSQRVTVEGAVKKQGLYPLRGKTSLLQIIAIADGLSEVAESEVVIVREVKGNRTATKFNLDELRSGTIADPQLLTGDFVIVGTSAIKTAINNVLKAVPLASLIKPF
jgi:polysaccharide biosynthesis/export protein